MISPEQLDKMEPFHKSAKNTSHQPIQSNIRRIHRREK